MVSELSDANLKNKRESLDTVADLLVGLRETWLEAIEINRQNTRPAVNVNPTERYVAASF